MTRSDKNLLAELSADFESSDAVSRYNYIPDDTILDDEDVFAGLADDFESSDGHSRYDYIDEIEPYDIDGQAEDEPEIVFDYISKTGENYYLFETTSSVKTPEPTKTCKQ